MFKIKDGQVMSKKTQSQSHSSPWELRGEEKKRKSVKMQKEKQKVII